MRITLITFFSFFFLNSFSQKLPEILTHQNCATARVVCNITDTPSEGSLCNGSCSGNNNLVNGTNSCFTGSLTRWGFYIFTIQQSGTLTFTINPNAPGFFECGDYNFALFDVTNGCGSIGNAIRCSIADDGCTGSNTGLNMAAIDTTEGTGGDGWNKYLNAQCGRTYLLCLDIPTNDGNGFGLSFGGTCTFGVPIAFTAVPDTVCAGQPVNCTLNCYTPNAWITYQWNFGPNATPQTYTGATPPAVTYSTTGLQTISITGTTSAGNGCNNSASQTVFVTNSAPTSDFDITTPVCLGTNATITYQGTASSSATYNWNFGSGTVVSGTGQGPYEVSWASAGTYSVTLDVTECIATSSVTVTTVTVFASPTASAGSDVTICSGSSTSLSGSGGGNYGWGPSGAGLSCTLCQNPVASPTTTTSYTLAVMDANGCTNTDVINVTVNPRPTASAGPDVSICANTSTSLSASGGTSYVWSPATNLSNANISNPSANPLSSASYTVTVTDASGCTNTDVVSITVNSLPTANAGADVTFCAGQNTTLSASGGTSYVWSPATDLSNATIPNPVASPTSNATYTVTVTDVNGCTNTDAINITVNAIPVANAGVDVSLCSGFNATLNASGGSSYSWIPSTALSNSTISNPVSNPTSSTTYTVIVSNGNCASTDVMTVLVNPIPSASVFIQTNVSCFGGSNGNATLAVTSGTSPFTYLWTPTSQNTQTATGLSAGTYSVVITDANGCTTNTTVNIIQPNALAATSTSTNVSCFAGSDGTATVNATGGTPSNTYFWLPGGGNTASVSGLAAGGYTVLVTDGNGCTTVSSVAVTQPNALATNFSSVNAGCGMTNGTAMAAASGGTGSYTYLWNNGQTSASATGLAQGNYSLTITDANGCTFTDTINVNEDAAPTAGITGNINLCLGESTQLTASGGGTYLWNTFQSTSSITVAPVIATGYSVIVTSGNCTDTATVNVMVNPLPTANAGADVTIPYGQSTQLSGSGTGSSYAWSPSSGLSCTNCQSPSANPLVTTDYIVVVTDANGCTDADTVTVFVDLTCKEIYLPNAFSPNADTENDELRIYINNLACIEEFKIMIWDRWGEKVFESTDPDFRWDGNYTRGLLKGEESTAVFVYRMKATLIGDKKVDKKGNVSLVR